MTQTLFSGFILVTLALCGEAAYAASFDCTNAGKPDEIAICKSQQLSDLDVRMATLYGVRMEIPMMMGARGAAQDEQKAFLAKRTACGSDVSCIESTYAARIAELDKTIKAAMQDYCRKIGLCG
jgi:uncharacterized protein